jgi:hypothetical protein
MEKREADRSNGPPRCPKALRPMTILLLLAHRIASLGERAVDAHFHQAAAFVEGDRAHRSVEYP